MPPIEPIEVYTAIIDGQEVQVKRYAPQSKYADWQAEKSIRFGENYKPTEKDRAWPKKRKSKSGTL